MNLNEIEKLCYKKEEELIDKYFGNIVEEAVSESHETIEGYTMDLPMDVEREYMDFLTDMWHKLVSDNVQPIENIIRNSNLKEALTESGSENLSRAYDDAMRITLWEKITSSNHKDVTYYKGLLLEYTRNLLSYCRCSFLTKVKDSVEQ